MKANAVSQKHRSPARPDRGSAETTRGSLFKASAAIRVVVLLAIGAASPVHAGVGEATGDGLSPAQILTKVQEKYGSLASYSDEGCVRLTFRDEKPIITFTTRLAHPSFYRIEWSRKNEATLLSAQSNLEAVWSSSVYHLLYDPWCGLRKEQNQDIALTHAAVSSYGVTTTVPRMFFKRQWGDQAAQVENAVFSERRLAEERLGNVGCYVVTWGPEGWTRSLWIGKQDFLIHQAQIVISTEAIRRAAVSVSCDAEVIRAMQGFTLTEIHTNIVLNQRFSRSDFVPSFPIFGISGDQ